MLKGKKPKQLKIIPILVFITLSFIATLFYIFLSDIQIVPILLKDYIDSGNSIFFPYIPYINILWYLPEKNKVIRLSIGQILDLIIIYNIISYIDTNFYHYIKMTIINGDIKKYNYEELGTSNEKNYSIFPNPEANFDFENEIRYFFEDIKLESTKKQSKLNKVRNLFNYQMKSSRFKILNNLYNTNSNFILTKYYNNFRFSLKYSSFKDSWIYIPFNDYFLLKTNNFYYNNKIKQLEGN